MGIDDAVRAAIFLNARINIPMHYKTFDVISADPNEFVKKVEAAGRKAVVVKPGGEYVIEKAPEVARRDETPPRIPTRHAACPSYHNS